MDAALLAPETRLPELEDIWLQLHLVFECIWDFRFLYRDLIDILSRNRRLRMRFARILKRASESSVEVMRGLVRAGIMRATATEVEATATNILVIATFWLNYASATGERDEQIARSEEHTSELQSLMRISYAVFCFTQKNTQIDQSEIKWQHTSTTARK